WVVGRPGSVVVHSADNGSSWKMHKTGQPLPLNGVFFRNDKVGWAVGELGTILTTTDAGQTWTVQHRRGQRAAVLLIHARATATPLDTVAWLGARDGYLTAALRVTGPDTASASPLRAGDGPRFAAALRQTGGAAGEMLWQFPVPGHLAHAERDDIV